MSVEIATRGMPGSKSNWRYWHEQSEGNKRSFMRQIRTKMVYHQLYTHFLKMQPLVL